MIRIPNAIIFSILRIIKQANPGDTYYDAYLGHLAKRGDSFRDTYHYAWERVISSSPKRVLEIGTRTGISLCQLLSAYIDYSGIERIVTCDLFNDGFISVNLAKHNLKLCGIPQSIIDKVEFLVGDSKTEIPKLEGKFDYCLIDGDHSREGARADLENVCKLVEQGGVIVFDDVSEDGCGLIDVWNSFKEAHKGEFEFNEDFNGKGLATGVKL